MYRNLKIEQAENGVIINETNPNTFGSITHVFTDKNEMAKFMKEFFDDYQKRLKSQKAE